MNHANVWIAFAQFTGIYICNGEVRDKSRECNYIVDCLKASKEDEKEIESVFILK